VGGGDRRTQLERFAAELGLADRCIFAGHRPGNALIALFDIGVLSSDWEGLPLVVLEYMAAGLPVVATRVGGVPEAVREGVSGFLVDAGDDAAMADRIVHLLERPELRKKMGAEGRRILDARFTKAAMMQRILQVYENVMRPDA
jgi:glycosyltransferase involved in cell wall biosynthesis